MRTVASRRSLGWPQLQKLECLADDSLDQRGALDHPPNLPTPHGIGIRPAAWHGLDRRRLSLRRRGLGFGGRGAERHRKHEHR